ACWRRGAEIEPLAPLPGRIAGLAAHHPAARAAEPSRRLEDDAGQSRRRQQDPTDLPIIAIELDAMIEAALEPRLRDVLHAAGPVTTNGISSVGFAHKFGAEKRCSGSLLVADPAHPTEFVGNVAALDADQLCLDGGRYRAGRTVGEHDVTRAALD